MSPGTLSVTNVLLVHHGQNMLNESASASGCWHCEPCSPESMTSCALRMTRLFPLHIGAHTKVDEEARALGGQRTKKEVVTQALLEYVQRRKQLKMLELFGTLDYDPDFDAGAQRRLARLLPTPT